MLQWQPGSTHGPRNGSPNPRSPGTPRHTAPSARTQQTHGLCCHCARFCLCSAKPGGGLTAPAMGLQEAPPGHPGQGSLALCPKADRREVRESRSGGAVSRLLSSLPSRFFPPPSLTRGGPVLLPVRNTAWWRRRPCSGLTLHAVSSPYEFSPRLEAPPIFSTLLITPREASRTNGGSWGRKNQKQKKKSCYRGQPGFDP